MTTFLRLASLYIEFGKYGVERIDLHNTVASRIQGVFFHLFLLYIIIT
jgi:hypothetical protein